jgi:hypothetical protein
MQSAHDDFVPVAGANLKCDQLYLTFTHLPFTEDSSTAVSTR